VINRQPKIEEEDFGDNELEPNRNLEAQKEESPIDFEVVGGAKSQITSLQAAWSVWWKTW
jgi:hypothetical protein